MRPRHDFIEHPALSSKDVLSVIGPEPGVRGLFFVSVNGRRFATIADSAFEAILACDDSRKKERDELEKAYRMVQGFVR